MPKPKDSGHEPDLTDEDLKAFLGDDSQDASNSNSDSDSSDDDKGDEPKGVSREDLDALRQEIRQELQGSQSQFVQALSQVSQTLQTLKGDTPRPDTHKPNPQDDEKVWALATKSPEVMRALVREEAKRMAGEQMKGFKGEFESTMKQRDMADRLRNNLLGHYQEEIQDKDSEILRSTQAVKDQISQFLDPSVRGTDLEDQLAFHVAAAMNPESVAKRHATRMAAEETRRATIRDRLAQLATGGKGLKATRNDITEDDKEIADIYGFDLSDEKVRAQVLAGKKSESMTVVGGGASNEGVE